MFTIYWAHGKLELDDDQADWLHVTCHNENMIFAKHTDQVEYSLGKEVILRERVKE